MFIVVYYVVPVINKITDINEFSHIFNTIPSFLWKSTRDVVGATSFVRNNSNEKHKRNILPFFHLQTLSLIHI